MFLVAMGQQHGLRVGNTAAAEGVGMGDWEGEVMGETEGRGGGEGEAVAGGDGAGVLWGGPLATLTHSPHGAAVMAARLTRPCSAPPQYTIAERMQGTTPVIWYLVAILEPPRRGNPNIAVRHLAGVARL